MSVCVVNSTRLLLYIARKISRVL